MGILELIQFPPQGNHLLPFLSNPEMQLTRAFLSFSSSSSSSSFLLKEEMTASNEMEALAFAGVI